jgi:transcriptional regulator with XRE-family HTH domain
MKTEKKERTNISGARVMQARQEQGLTRGDLLIRLQRMGIKMSLPTLSFLERQKRRVTDCELAVLAKALNVSVSWLLGRET